MRWALQFLVLLKMKKLRWIYILAQQRCRQKIRVKNFALYTDLWLEFCWCAVDILRNYLVDWLSKANRKLFEIDSQKSTAKLVQRTIYLQI